MISGAEATGTNEGSHSNEDLPILFFDSSCLLCHRAVRWIIRHDPEKNFSFAELDSQTASRLIPGDHPIRNQDTVILLNREGIWGRSEAVFRTLRQLKTCAKALLLFSVLPRGWTDRAYRLIASRRYRWFGRDESCPLPDPGAAGRFLD